MSCGATVPELRRSLVGKAVKPAASILATIPPEPAMATVCPAASAALATGTRGWK